LRFDVRIAIVSDIHGNRTAFEAVLADLRRASPDLILHGGDLPHGGASPAEIVDRIRELGWPGVLGNTDEMLFAPQTLTDFAALSPKLQPLFAVIEEMAAWTREALGEKRIAWLKDLPRVQVHGSLALVHASPESTWRAPAPEAGDAEFEATYSQLGKAIAAYGHIHHAFVRRLPKMTVANTGSVSLSYDGDPRATYLLLDGNEMHIRRVEYDIDSESKRLARCGLPHADWVAKSLATASFLMP
jgi:predicted phosphodiesterase